MTDDQTPPSPSLRLKPRLRSVEGTVATEAPTAGAPEPLVPTASSPSPAPTAGVSTPKIRFKPRTELANPAAASAEASPVVASATLSEAPTLPETPTPPQGVVPASGEPPVEPRFKPRAITESAAPAVSPIVATPAPAIATPATGPQINSGAASASADDANRFKLKPKLPTPPPAVVATAAPLPVPASAGIAAPRPLATPPAGSAAPLPVPAATQSPPPFPVVAAPKNGKVTPPIPHLSVNTPVAQPEKNVAEEEDDEKTAFWKQGLFKYGVIAVLILIGVGYRFGRDVLVRMSSDKLRETMSKPSKPAEKKAPSAASAPAPTTQKTGPTPSETLNQIAQAPANAINKVQDAIEKRRASGQANVEAVLTGEPSAAATPTPGVAPKTTAPATKSATKSATATTTVAPGLSATTELEAASEASVAFRQFVANAKVSGVVATRAIVNGRLVRAGEIVDAGLGISFEGFDLETKRLQFKDKSGATVSRRY